MRIKAIILVLFIISCGSTRKTVDRSYSFKDFQGSKGTLVKKRVALVNVFLYKFSTNVQVLVNDKPCFVLLVSGQPEKCSDRSQNEQQEMIYPPSHLVAVYVPVKNLKLIKSIQDLKCGSKITAIKGICHYPSLNANSCFFDAAVKIPGTAPGLLVISIEYSGEINEQERGENDQI